MNMVKKNSLVTLIILIIYGKNYYFSIFQKLTIFHNLVVYKPNLKLANQNLIINNQIIQIYSKYISRTFLKPGISSNGKMDNSV